MAETITGRFKENKIEMFDRMHWDFFGKSSPSYLRTALGVLGESAENTHFGIAFSKSEDRCVAVMISRVSDGRLVYDQIRANEMYRGREVTCVVVDDVESDGATHYHSAPLAKLFDQMYDYDWPVSPLLQNNVSYAKSAMLRRETMMGIPEPIKPMKQNGRSASYLDLDPTKKNINKRRKR